VIRGHGAKDHGWEALRDGYADVLGILVTD
jgi:hypothetical protein